MKINIFCFVFVFVSLQSFSQSLAWAKKFDGASNDQGRGICVDALGNVYTTGYFSGTVDFDPGVGTYNLTATNSNAGYEDIFISKLDSSGNFIWAKKMDGMSRDYSHSITLDGLGNILITGKYSGKCDFNPGTDTFFLTPNYASYSDIFILKLDTSGNFVWAKSMGGVNMDFGASIKVDSSGNVYTTGSFIATVDFDPGLDSFKVTSAGSNDIFILKLDASGNFVWVKCIGSNSGENANSIYLDKNGNIYTTGYYSKTTDFDPDTGTYNLTQEGAFVLKMNPSGGFVWVKPLGRYPCVGNAIVVNFSGEVYSTGFFASTMDFNPGSGIYNLTTNGALDAYISKLDTNGDFLWAKNIGGSLFHDQGNALTLDKAGNLYCIGEFSGTVDFDPGILTNFITSYGNVDMYILKLDEAGNFVGVMNIGGTSTVNGYSIAIDSSGNILTTGAFAGTADFDPGYPVLNLISTANNDIFISKLGPCFSVSPADSINGSTILCAKETKWYTVPYVSSATGYIWTVPPGSVINSGQNTPYINVTFGNISGYIKVVTENACGLGRPDSIFINIKTPLIISQPTNQGVIVGGTAQFIATALSTTTKYQWQINTGLGFTNITNSSKYWGVTNDTLFINNVSLAMNNSKLRCVMIDSPCINISDTAYLTVTCDLHVITQPTNQVVNAGLNAKFTVAASNVDALYQWQEDTGNGFVDLINTGRFSGVTTDTLQISNVSFTQNNLKLRCVISDAGCYDTSTIVKVNVQCSIQLTLQPVHQTNTVGSEVKFIAATTSANATYRWQLDIGSGFSDLSNSSQYLGISSDTLIVRNIQMYQNNYRYRCIASENGCMDTSASVILTVTCALHFKKQPLNESVSVGSDVLFVALASSNTANYQWQIDSGHTFINLNNAMNYTGVTKDTLMLKSAELTQHAKKLRCIIQDAGCYDTSNIVELQVYCNSKFNLHPLTKSILAGSPIQFQVNASVNTATFQWQTNIGTGFIDLKPSALYSGENLDTLRIFSTNFSQHANMFRCILKDGACADTSKTALLFVECTLSVLSHPKNQFVKIGDTAVFTISSSSTNATYQWQQNTGTGFIDLPNNARYSGINTNTLKINAVDVSLNNYLYQCIVSENGCVIAGMAAALYVENTEGISDLLMKRGFTIFPNPVLDLLIVEVISSDDNEPFTLLDLTGRVVMSGFLKRTKNELPFKDLTKGFYVLRVGEPNMVTFKVVHE